MWKSASFSANFKLIEKIYVRNAAKVAIDLRLSWDWERMKRRLISKAEIKIYPIWRKKKLCQNNKKQMVFSFYFSAFLLWFVENIGIWMKCLPLDAIILLDASSHRYQHRLTTKWNFKVNLWRRTREMNALHTGKWTLNNGLISAKRVLCPATKVDAIFCVSHTVAIAMLFGWYIHLSDNDAIQMCKTSNIRRRWNW